MTNQRNAYNILGIEPNASAEQIEGAYKRLAKAMHPDVNKRPTAEKEFKDINWAKGALLDPKQRSEHDFALMKVAAVPDDDVDVVLKQYEIKPKKKKKKKKKPAPDMSEQFIPPYVPPPVNYGGHGRGDFESIPEGYDNHGDVGFF